MTSVETQEAECLHLAPKARWLITSSRRPNSKAHSIFDYPWLGLPTNNVWRPWEDQSRINSTLGGILHALTAAYLGERQVKSTKTDCSYRVRLHTDRAAGGKILPTCWTGHGRKISLKDLGGDEWDELALFRWNERGLSPRVFCDERTSWGLEDCLKQMGAFDRDVLKFAVERIMKKRVQRKREAKARMRMRHSQGTSSFPLLLRPSMILIDPSAFGRLYSPTVIEECRALKGTW